jgi:N-acetylneuraminic acid mutarotase
LDFEEIKLWYFKSSVVLLKPYTVLSKNAHQVHSLVSFNFVNFSKNNSPQEDSIDFGISRSSTPAHILTILSHRSTEKSQKNIVSIDGSISSVMNRIHLSILSSGLVSALIYACHPGNIPYTQNGNWIYRGDFNGIARSESVAFVIGNNAYVGSGIDNNFNHYNDLWELTLYGTNCSWYQVATASAMTPRYSAVAFSVGGQGYVGSGTNGTTPMSDFWHYDPLANNWNQIASLGDSLNGPAPRFDAVAFGIESVGYGYVGTGNNYIQYLKDFWQYNPATDTWTAKVSYDGTKRTASVVFVYNNCGYLVTGLGTGGVAVNDMWKFDPSQPDSSSWTELNHITNYSPESFDDAYTTISRWNAVGFVMLGVKSDGGGDKGYITTGTNGASYSWTWEYDFANDLWTEKTPFERAGRQGAVGFSLQNRGFVGLGISGGTNYEDLNEWFPDEQENPYD